MFKWSDNSRRKKKQESFERKKEKDIKHNRKETTGGVCAVTNSPGSAKKLIHFSVWRLEETR